MRFRLRTLMLAIVLGPPPVFFAVAASRDGEAAALGILVMLGFAAIASLSWYFAPRPRLFVRVFVPRDEWRVAIRNCVQNSLFEQSLRTMSKLQFTVALWTGAGVAICSSFS